MGDGTGIPVDVKTLIAEKIESVEHIEILLLLRANPARDFSAADVSQKLRNNTDSAERRMIDLAAKGLLAVVPGEGGARFRYQPSSDALSECVDKLAKTYQERRVSVVNLIFSKPLERIQVFADAFKIRKDKDDG